MKILITGASGLLGANLSLLAAQEGHTVHGLYHENAVRVKGCTMHQCDLVSCDLLAKIEEIKPDAIVHCAALTNVDLCEGNPQLAEKMNVTATQKLLAAAHGTRTIFISTDSVFDGSKSFHTEDEKPGPLNTYARTKYAAEQLVLAIPNTLVVRTNLYGFNIQNKQSFSEWIHAKFAQKETITGFTDYFFSPIHATNLSRALIELAQKKDTGILHVAGQGRISKYEFAKQYARIFGFDEALVVPTTMAELHLKAKRPHDCSLDISKAKKILKTKLLGVVQGIEEYKRMYDEGYPNELKGN